MGEEYSSSKIGVLSPIKRYGYGAFKKWQMTRCPFSSKDQLLLLTPYSPTLFHIPLKDLPFPPFQPPSIPSFPPQPISILCLTYPNNNFPCYLLLPLVVVIFLFLLHKCIESYNFTPHFLLLWFTSKFTIILYQQAPFFWNWNFWGYHLPFDFQILWSF